MTLDTYPRLSDKALQILAACTEEFRTSHDIAADAGMAGTGLTAWVGAYDRETRAKWRGTGRSDSYWALVDISEQGNAFTASLVDLGYVELRKDKRRVLIKITPKGRQAQIASELGQTRIPASNDDDNSLGDEATLQGGKVQPTDERSLGDRSTFGGSGGSSLSDLGEFTDLPDHDMEIVDLSSRYTIEKTLGKGGMGEVLLATDTRLDRKVAIKRIRGDAGSSKAAVARFLTEAKSVATLNHHNIVQIHDYGRDKHGPFLIMEYVPGGTLLDRCKQGPIELEEAIDLACQLCDGLGRAHDAGIIHRDIKPANILLTNDGAPKLSDFGLAKAESSDQTLTMAGAVLGTLDFMPPEQRQDASLVDARSDLWSLAATLYQMVTGKSPKIIRFDSLPSSITNVFGKALEESRDDRFQSASDFKESLQHSLERGAETTTELEQGECPSCGTKNDVSRKFCRNPSCAASLETTCLSCTKPISLWEQVCGHCGLLQPELLEKRRAEMFARRAEAETCLAGHDYASAYQIAREINSEGDPRLQQLKSWSGEFPELVESTKQAQIGNAEQAIAEALSHEEAYDYRSGIKAIKQIPSALLAVEGLAAIHTARETLARIQEKHEHAGSLEAEIKSRISARNLSGLLSPIESLLELLPDRTDLLNLQQQLQKRESDLEEARINTLAAATASMQQHDYANALTVIAKLAPEKIDNEVAELQFLAKSREARSQELIRQIRQAVNAHQHEGLLALIEEYLTLKPADSDALKSRDKLIAREKKHQGQAAARLAQKREAAEKKRTRKLQIIVGSSIATAFVLMLSVMFYLRAQRTANDIADAIGRGEYAAALELDPDNEQARAMRQNAEILATALKARDYRKALQLDPGNAEAMTMKIAANIQQALSDGDYASALQLDPANAKALSMQRKSADLQQALSDGDYAAALQLDPGNAVALSMQKRSADIQQALSDGDYAAALQLDPDNAEALSMQKRSADIQQALSDGNYATVLQLDPDNAEALSMQKRSADLKQALSDGDYATALQLDPGNAEALSMQKTAEIQRALSDGDYATAVRLDPSGAVTAMIRLSPVQNSIGMKLKLLPPGVFTMGNASGEKDEKPQHEVKLTKPFLIGVHEITQEQYKQVMRTNPSSTKGENHPVDSVTWDDAMNFCRKLSALPDEKAAGRVYRLPTEAEWEYACRAGTRSQYSFGDDASELGQYAWYSNNSDSTTHSVGGKKPNAWGLYDMHGNVWEWCQDWFGNYPSGSVTDPHGAASGSDRIGRGGCSTFPAESCRSAYRDWDDPSERYNLSGGFRVCLSPSGK